MASRHRGSAALTAVVAKTATCPNCWTSSSTAWRLADHFDVEHSTFQFEPTSHEAHEPTSHP